ncbi:uncharacterized protein BDR25DRAFT_209933, partial [Lindgomyces ingoldianus]
VNQFIKRYYITLISQWTSGRHAAHKKADSAFKYLLYLEPIRREIDQYGIEPRHTYYIA